MNLKYMIEHPLPMMVKVMVASLVLMIPPSIFGGLFVLFDGLTLAFSGGSEVVADRNAALNLGLAMVTTFVWMFVGFLAVRRISWRNPKDLAVGYTVFIAVSFFTSFFLLGVGYIL